MEELDSGLMCEFDFLICVPSADSDKAILKVYINICITEHYLPHSSFTSFVQPCGALCHLNKQSELLILSVMETHSQITECIFPLLSFSGLFVNNEMEAYAKALLYYRCGSIKYSNIVFNCHF